MKKKTVIYLNVTDNTCNILIFMINNISSRYALMNLNYLNFDKQFVYYDKNS